MMQVRQTKRHSLTFHLYDGRNFCVQGNLAFINIRKVVNFLYAVAGAAYEERCLKRQAPINLSGTPLGFVPVDQAIRPPPRAIPSELGRASKHAAAALAAGRYALQDSASSDSPAGQPNDQDRTRVALIYPSSEAPELLSAADHVLFESEYEQTWTFTDLATTLEWTNQSEEEFSGIKHSQGIFCVSWCFLALVLQAIQGCR